MPFVTVRYQARLLRLNHAQALIQISPNPAKYADMVMTEGTLSALTKIKNCFA